MRYIDLNRIDTSDPEVIAWLKKANEKLAILSSIKSHEKRAEFFSKNNLWSKFKSILIRYFGEKCWYSECSLEGSFADVDHFRPKNRSIDLSGDVILDDGYWWLAYDYRNYRLSCEKCNRRFGSGGKSEFFPLRPGTRPAHNGTSGNEEILLIDPCNASDVSLIGFNEEGKVIPLTNDPWLQQRVTYSIELYNLDVFNNSRKRVMLRCKNALLFFDLVYYSDASMTEALESLRDLTSEYSAYSTVAKQYISLKIEGKPYAEELSQFLHLDPIVDAAAQNERNPLDATG